MYVSPPRDYGAEVTRAPPNSPNQLTKWQGEAHQLSEHPYMQPFDAYPGRSESKQQTQAGTIHSHTQPVAGAAWPTGGSSHSTTTAADPEIVTHKPPASNMEAVNTAVAHPVAPGVEALAPPPPYAELRPEIY